ncbi:MAG TPA: ABC transporter permease, partial [Ktedonobacteraceae bacterium]|nr:ABC transporter permease [Ktedonobacteraceae bacterium]
MLRQLSRKPTPEPAPSEQPSAVSVSKGGAARIDTARNVGLIIKHEYKKRVTQRSFIISTIILLVLIVLATFVPTVIKLIASRSNSQTKITIVNHVDTIAGLNDGALTNYINTSLNGTNGATGQNTAGNAHFVIQMVSTDNTAGLQQQVKDGSLGILLVIDRAPNNKDLQYTYYSTSAPANDSDISQVQTLASQLSLLDKSTSLGLTPAQTTSLFAQPQFSDVNLGQAPSNRSEGDAVAGYILAYAGNILIYMAIILYGLGVAMGVAEEKGSRVMEILVNAATPFQLMAGKIIGLGAAGLTQMALLVIAGIGGLLLQIPLQAVLLGSNAGILNLNITGSTIALLLLLLLYFILGFLLYASLYAALGALVKRQDEVQNAVQPLTMVLVVGYLVGFFGIYAPDATWMRVISYIPFWSPMVMLIRVGVSNVAWWEIVLTIVLMLGSIAICSIIAGRIYRFGVLMYGQRPNLRQLVG